MKSPLLNRIELFTCLFTNYNKFSLLHGLLNKIKNIIRSKLNITKYRKTILDMMLRMSVSFHILGFNAFKS